MHTASCAGGLVAAIEIALLATPGPAAAATCAPAEHAADEAAAAMRGMYAAALADDGAGFKAVTAPDFYVNSSAL